MIVENQVELEKTQTNQAETNPADTNLNNNSKNNLQKNTNVILIISAATLIFLIIFFTLFLTNKQKQNAYGSNTESETTSEVRNPETDDSSNNTQVENSNSDTEENSNQSDQSNNQNTQVRTPRPQNDFLFYRDNINGRVLGHPKDWTVNVSNDYKVTSISKDQNKVIVQRKRETQVLASVRSANPVKTIHSPDSTIQIYSNGNKYTSIVKIRNDQKIKNPYVTTSEYEALSNQQTSDSINLLSDISTSLSNELSTYNITYGNRTYTLRYPANTWELFKENDEIKLRNKNNLDITLSVRIKSKYSGGGYCYEILEKESNTINSSINFKVFQGKKSEDGPCVEMLSADAKKYLIYATVDLTNETVLEI
ncbi:MAG: hypothetical protein N3A71_01605 [Candidatus Dojkabacteria bacterium]|nr:hypothetical protein [Candidatus Dojkabacteria bacterium]